MSARVWMVFAVVVAGCKGTEPEWTPPDVVINELMASNATGLQDESLAFPDWIELANLGDEDVDLSSYTLTDDALLPQKWSFPAGSAIEAGGFLIVFADADPSTVTELHTSFRLEVLGEELVLFGPALEDLPIIDEVQYPEQVTDVSYARQPNGTGAFASDDTPTPGAVND